MAETVLYLVLLPKTVPEEILRALGRAYLHRVNGNDDPQLVSTHFEVAYPFVKLTVLAKDGRNPRIVWLATQHVLAVEALASEDARQKFGFRS